MHRPTLARTQQRTRTRSRSTTRTRALENWLPWHWTSRNRARSRSLSARRSGPYRRLVHRTRPRMRDDHARRRCLRTLCNRSRWSRCCWWRWLWRGSNCRRHRSWRCGLCHRRRRGRRVCGRSRHWHRRGRCSRRRWLDNWWRRNGKCRPYGRLRNDDPRRRRRGRRRLRCRSSHRRDGGRCR
jgi:hypothetical protein